MASNFYDKRIPDYGDLDNKTKTCPGFRFGVRENDGGIGIYMGPANDDVDDDTYYKGFLNLREAEELVEAFEEAIERARPKNKGKLAHRSRVTQS